MTQLFTLTATEARRAIADGMISSTDLVRACLERIQDREPLVGAWAHLDPQSALRQAQVADDVRKSGGTLRPLHGIPVGIKDIIDTQDLPTEYGTGVFAGRRPERDAEVVRRLRAAGAIILGKTVTTELAFYGPGKTRNPIDPDRTPGGSSSGSAASVADHHVPLALGSQTAGSILRPASYCGVIGFKPTFGMIPLDGVLAQSPPLDTLGGYARNIEDIAILTSVLAARPMRVDTSRRSVRLAFVRTPSWPQGDEGMRAAFLEMAEKNRQIITEVELPAVFADTGGLQRAVQFRDIARNYGPIVEANPELVSAKLKEVVSEGRTVSDAEYNDALARRETLQKALEPILEMYDAIVTPAAPGIAPMGLASTGSPLFNFLWTYLGLPAISVPLLAIDDLPLGVQLVGRAGDDADLLRVASFMMQQLGTS